MPHSFLINIFPQHHGTPVAFFIAPEGEQVLDKYLCFSDKARIAYEILAYLMDHPDARDTLDGIVQWWLPEREFRYRVTSVKEAIEELLKDGWVTARKGQDSRTYYRINEEKRTEIEKLCRQSST